MNLHRIADLTVDMGYKYERLKKQAAIYRIAEDIKPDITIYLSYEFLKSKQEENKNITPEIAEYLYTGNVFYSALVNYDGFMLHASAILMDGYCYLFSAPSGTGKSYHASLWQKVYGRERAKIINDDKPAIRIDKDGVFAYGTPWSGKTDLNLNVKVPIAGICFLERGEKNEIVRENGGAKILKVLSQTVRPNSEENMDKLLKSLDFVLKKVPIYTMQCTMEEEAAKVAYEAMRKEVK